MLGFTHSYCGLCRASVTHWTYLLRQWLGLGTVGPRPDCQVSWECVSGKGSSKHINTEAMLLILGS